MQKREGVQFLFNRQPMNYWTQSRSIKVVETQMGETDVTSPYGWELFEGSEAIFLLTRFDRVVSKPASNLGSKSLYRSYARAVVIAR